MIKRILAGSILALGLIGCGGSGNNSGTCYVYGINAISNLGSLSITANGTTVVSGAAYQASSSAFVSTNAGTDALLYLTNSSNSQLASGSTTFTSGDYYTAYAIGNAINQYLFVYETNVTPPTTANTGRLIFVDASIAQPSVDIYITLSGGVQGSAAIRSLTPFTTGLAAEVDNLPTGTYDVQFKVAGTTTVLVDEPSVTIGTTAATNEVQIVGISDTVPTTGATTQAALPVISVPFIAGSTFPRVKNSHPIVIGHPGMTEFPK
jgi:hypothetical protein